MAGENLLPAPADCAADAPACPPADAGATAPDLDVRADASAPKVEELLDRMKDVLASSAAAIASAGRAVGDAVLGLARGIGSLLDGLVASLRGMDKAEQRLAAYSGVAVGGATLSVPGFRLMPRGVGRKLLAPLALLPGFSRIAKDELLEHDGRAKLFDAIRENPGVRLGELAKALEMPWGTTLHHLRKLRADRLITFQSVGAHKCYFVNGSGLSPTEMQAASHIRGDTLEGVASWINAHPKTNLKELAAGLGISSPLAAFHVGKLQRAGLVQKVRDGRAVRLILSARLPGPLLAATAPPGSGPGLCPTPA